MGSSGRFYAFVIYSDEICVMSTFLLIVPPFHPPISALDHDELVALKFTVAFT